jgi:hypothetical protein
LKILNGTLLEMYLIVDPFTCVIALIQYVIRFQFIDDGK